MVWVFNRKLNVIRGAILSARGRRQHLDPTQFANKLKFSLSFHPSSLLSICSPLCARGKSKQAVPEMARSSFTHWDESLINLSV